MFVTLVFTVRDPISVNAMYGTRHGQRRRFLTKVGREFKQRAVAAASVARAAASWPSDPFRVAKARLSYQLFDYKGDTDGPAKALRDSLERVLYWNDRDVEDGAHPFSIRDGNGRRVIVTVELLELRTAEEASAARAAFEQRLVINAKNRAARAAKKVKLA